MSPDQHGYTDLRAENVRLREQVEALQDQISALESLLWLVAAK